MRRIFMTCITAAAASVALAQAPVIDGLNIAPGFNWGSPLATQDTNTQFGNNQNELNRLFVTSDAANIYIGISGNLADNNALTIWFDTTAQPPTPGGEVVTTTSGGMSCPAGAVPTVVQMLSNTTFDSGFLPEYVLLVSVGAFPGQGFPPHSPLVYACDVVNINALTSVPLGIGAIGTGNGNLTGNTGAAIAVDNRNIDGVGSFCYDPDDPNDPNDPFCDTRFPAPGLPESATSGIEIKLPKSLIGVSGATTIYMFAYVTNNAQDFFGPGGQIAGPCGRFGYGSNQGLPGLGGNGNLASFTPGGQYRLNFEAVPGLQYATVALP